MCSAGSAMQRSVASVSLLLSVALSATSPAALAASVGDSATASSGSLLFFDSTALQQHNLSQTLGKPTLLSTMTDPSVFVGWGYVSVFPVAEPTTAENRVTAASAVTHRMIYSGNLHPTHTPRVVQLASSTDGIHFSPAPTTLQPNSGPRMTPNQLVGDVPGTRGFSYSTCFDDSRVNTVKGERLKMIIANTSVLTSDDGLVWSLSPYRWAKTAVDPYQAVFRTHEGHVGVTSRPPSLRRGPPPHGRHIGIQISPEAGAGAWGSLGASDPGQCEPLDGLYRQANQFYGMSVFDTTETLGGYVGFPVRYNCSPADCTWAGGHLYGELAWSTNGLNFSRVGEQPLFPNVGLPNAVYPELLSAGQVYPTSMLPSPAGDGSWLVYAAVASVQHGHGVDQGGDGWNCTGCSGISTYRIEKDRFVGLSGPGELRTVPLRLLAVAVGEVPQLRINVVVEEGGKSAVHAQLSHPTTHHPLPGFAFADSSPATRDSVGWQPDWRGRTVEDVAQDKVVLELRLAGSSTVYSVRGAFEPQV